MVKKLFKHEFKYYLRTLPLIYVVLIALGISSRILQIFQNDSDIYSMVLFSSSAMLCFAIVASSVLTTVAIVLRFYKNLYSSEGYLTLTLPISFTQHILVKLVTAVAVQLLNMVAIGIAGAIVLSGPSFSDTVRVILDEFFDGAFNGVGLVNMLLYAIELFVMLVCSLVFGDLVLYACVSIGQTAKKNRILLSIGCYFIYNTAVQVLSTAGMIVLSILAASGALEDLILFCITHPIIWFHLYGTVPTIITAALSFAIFLLIRSIMSKKLNLE
jgi:hypothetical protein